MADKPIVINNFQQGAAVSPLLGFGYMQGGDIDSLIGSFKAAFSSKNSPVFTPTNLIKWFVQDPDTPANLYALDRSGNVYLSQNTGTTWANQAGMTATITIASPAVVSATGHGLSIGDSLVFQTTGTLPTGITAGTTYYVITAGFGANSFEISASPGGSAINTSGSQSGTHSFICNTSDSGDGFLIFKKYLFKFRNAAIDVMKLADGTWTWNWKTSNDGLNAANSFHPALWGQDDIAYIGNKSNLASLQQVAGKTFAPGDSTTYTWNNDALSLPTNYSIKCLGELGQNLYIGTTASGGASSAKLADVFPWDRVSATFALPIRLFDFGVHQMCTVDNYLYFVVGLEHTLYQTNGFFTQIVRKLASNVSAFDNTYTAFKLNPYPGAIIKQRNRVMTGVSQNDTSIKANAYGVWSMNGQAAMNDYIIATPGTGLAEVGALFSISPYVWLIGDSTGLNTYGIRLIDTTTRNTSATFHSPFLSVGTTLEPRSFSKMNILLDRPIDNGTTIVPYYRYSLSDSWTQLTNGTITSGNFGLVSHVEVPAGIIIARTLQIRLDLSDTNNIGIGIKEVNLF